MTDSILNICDDLTIWLTDGRKVNGYYTCCRVSDGEVPAGMFRYDIREDADGEGRMCELKEFVWVNHHGTFITATPIDCKDGIEIVEWDFSPWSE